MAFVSFIAEGRTTYGIARPDGVFDLGRHIGAAFPDLRSLLTAQSLGRIASLPEPTATDYATGQFTYLPIIPNPSKILCVGLNYEDHRVETGRKKMDYPTLFTRFADTLTGHQTPMLLPAASTSFDYEGELAVIIGKHGLHVPENHALDLVAGFSIFNDGSIRDWQRHTNQFTPGKNFPSTAGFGPTLVTPTEAGILPGKSIQTHLNGQLVQSAHLGDMIFSIARDHRLHHRLHPPQPRRRHRHRHPRRRRLHPRTAPLHEAPATPSPSPSKASAPSPTPSNPPLANY